jgi:spore germination cell wall hydrolase CwlJ-like protein
MVQKEWAESYAIAKRVMESKVKLKIDMTGVTHYHADRVNPYWAKDHKDYKLVARIGNHLFYRWKKATLPKWEPSQELAKN